MNVRWLFEHQLHISKSRVMYSTATSCTAYIVEIIWSAAFRRSLLCMVRMAHLETWLLTIYVVVDVDILEDENALFLERTINHNILWFTLEELKNFLYFQR